MKKSKTIQLVLITAALASCNSNTKTTNAVNAKGGNTYVRGDSTAPYSRTHHGAGLGMWYYAFRPMFGYSNGVFGRSGFYSNGISNRSNFGTNGSKSNSVRGGFGRSWRVGS